MDNLFSELSQLGLGCHVGPAYAGAFGYADDVALLSPTIYGLRKMISICEKYAVDFHITFNPIKSKLICYNIDSSSVPSIYLQLEDLFHKSTKDYNYLHELEKKDMRCI